jgi:hypothetical protein
MIKIFAKKKNTNSKLISSGLQKNDSNEVRAKQNDSNEMIAAISMALHLFLNSARDEESEIITIDMPSAHYSPWALKSLVMKRVVRR